MQRRSREEIAAAILESARKGARKTQLMYSSMTSYHQLAKYLAVFVSEGLIEYRPKEKKYFTTGKGVQFLEVHEMGGGKSQRETL